MDDDLPAHADSPLNDGDFEHPRQRSRDRERFRSDNGYSRRRSRSKSRSRSRSRSLSPYSASRRRRASPPPYDRYDRRGGYSSRPLGGDPLEFEYLLTFKQFSSMVDVESRPLSESELRRRYDVYREKFQIKTAKAFFDVHKEDEWLMERYHPTKCEAYVTEMDSYAKEEREFFEADLAAGVLNDFSLEITPPTKSAGPDSAVASEGEAGEETAVPKVDSTPALASVLPTTETSLRWLHRKSNSLVYVKTVPPRISRQSLIEQLGKKVDGFERLYMGDPNSAKKLHRVAWIKYRDDVDVPQAIEALDKTKIDDFEFYVTNWVVSERTVMAPEAMSTRRRLTKDLKQAYNLIRGFDAERKLEPLASLMPPSDTESLDISQLRRHTDLCLLYLRRVHSFCYYCVTEAEEPDLVRKCGRLLHLRLSETPSTPTAPHFEKRLDDQVEMIGRRFNKLAKLNEMAENKVSEKKIVMVKKDEKYKCSECAKMFKGESFVKIHLMNKHPELMKAAIDEERYLEAFLADIGRYDVYFFQMVNTPAAPQASVPQGSSQGMRSNGGGYDGYSQGYSRGGGSGGFWRGGGRMSGPGGYYRGSYGDSGGGRRSSFPPNPPSVDRPMSSYTDLDAQPNGEMEIDYTLI